MNTQEAANLATKEANPVIDGRKANVNLAYLGAKPRVIPSPASKFNLDPSVIDLLLLTFVPRVVQLNRYRDRLRVYPFGSGTKCRSKPSGKTRRGTE